MDFQGVVMNPGKTLFAQLMACMPWTSFRRIVDRHGGDPYRIRGPKCALLSYGPPDKRVHPIHQPQ